MGTGVSGSERKNQQENDKNRAASHAVECITVELDLIKTI